VGQVIINDFFSWYDDLFLNSHVAQCLRLDMIRSYCLLTVFVLSFLAGAENAVQLLGHGNLADY
jgi:hypothetical protein